MAKTRHHHMMRIGAHEFGNQFFKSLVRSAIELEKEPDKMKS
ncbi:hypothetical protein A4R44_00827 [Amycolatopsis sp. M39]|nr:hypothetical protein A4R44_00827 [Amycolatopsis sp. M39]